jgi:DNA-binding NarL/FixJ family response regulator
MRADVCVLVVNSPGRHAESLRVLLRAMSHVEVVGQVENAEAAWKIIAECDPGLVVVDLALPHDEPYMLLQRLAADRPETGRLALATSNDQVHTAGNSGATETLLVPLTLDRLRVGIRNAIGRARPVVR